MEKGSQQAKERGKKMREAKEKKQNFEEKITQRIDNLTSTIAMMTDGFDKRIGRLEGSKNEQSVPERSDEVHTPHQKEEKTEVEGLEILPYKAKETLKQKFPEAKIHKVKPHKGGFMIVVDLTDITGGRQITHSRDGRPKQTFERDYRNIPVKAMSIEKSIKDRVGVIKKNLGWIEEKQVPKTIKRELKPEERPLPDGVKGTPEAEFFNRDVK